MRLAKLVHYLQNSIIFSLELIFKGTAGPPMSLLEKGRRAVAPSATPG